MTRVWRRGLAAATLGLAACTPTFDWRDVRPDDAGVKALFPCKPGSHARPLRVAGRALKMTMYACEAGGATFALGFADAGGAADAKTTLAEWKEAARRNVDGRWQSDVAFPLSGADGDTPPSFARLSGRSPRGEAIEVAVLLFARGGVAYQATVFGTTLDSDTLETFFSSLKLDG